MAVLVLHDAGASGIGEREVGMHAAAGVRLERLGHKAGYKTFAPRQGARDVSHGLEIVSGLQWIGVTDVDFDLTRAIFGGDLLHPDIHRLEGVANAVE